MVSYHNDVIHQTLYEEDKSIGWTLYRGIIDSLLLNNICLFSTCKESYSSAIKKILKYLKKIIKLRLWYHAY